MAFALIITNISDGEQKHLLSDRDVRNFKKNITAGAADKNDLILKNSQLSDQHFSIVKDNNCYCLIPEKGKETPVFYEKELLSGILRLQNGTTFFAGDKKFRFIFKPELGTCPRKKDLLTLFSSLIVVFILIFEIFLVSWLPHKIETRKIWEMQIIKQRSFDIMDSLRRKINSLSETNNKTEKCAEFLSKYLNDYVAYIRKNQNNLKLSQWRKIHNDFLQFESIVFNIQKKNIWSGPKEIEITTALQNMLENQIQKENNNE
ncbi:MAG: FHA domain-containing protein [Verrucomicrobiota bacterium]|nr:FHA domain-containing protein [Verrucomicrobiota bacterium]